MSAIPKLIDQSGRSQAADRDDNLAAIALSVKAGS
jgi:hypothetical protein